MADQVFLLRTAAAGKNSCFRGNAVRVIWLSGTEIKQALSPERGNSLSQLPAEPHRRDAGRKPRGVGGLNRDCAERRRPTRGLELAGRDAAGEAVQWLGLCPADH